MEMNVIPFDKKIDKDYLKFLKFLDRLDFMGELSGSQRSVLRNREARLEKARRGILPDWLESQAANNTEWKAELPVWLSDQRNQMTGPGDDAELVVKLINSGSPGVMLDLEDSMANTSENLLLAHSNIKKALYGELSYRKRGVKHTAKTHEGSTVIFTRVRGLHLTQMYPTRTKSSKRTAASLFDLAMLFYDLDLSKMAHAPCIYIPKSESAQEARWWKKAFSKIEKLKHWPRGTIKCMALVEAHSLAYEIEEFSHALQPYLVGLNLGRWDYMASLIDYMYYDAKWYFPDRNSIPSDVPFFQNLRHWIAHVCHKHGMLAIGGMSAMYPDRKNVKRNVLAQKKLKADKENEAACLMDGAWTGHPDQNEIAVNAFPHPNQIHKMPGLTELPDLREFDIGDLMPPTEEGTREAIRTCIQYRQAVIDGKGAKLINGFMEDLATDRIYRIMIAQRLDRRLYSEEQLWEMFDEECFALDDKPREGTDATIKLISERQFNPK